MTRARPAAGLVIVIAIVAAAAVVRWRLAGIPLERDEGEYAYAAQLVLDGVPPYALAYNMKFPGTYYAYAAIMAVFGESAWAIRIGLLIVNAATTFVLFAVGRRLIGGFGATIAAGVFALISLDRGVMGTFAHATQFILLPMLGGVALLLRAEVTGRRGTFAAAGILFGLAVLMKQQAAAFALMAVALALRPAWTPPRDWKLGLQRAGLAGAGLALPMLLVAGVLAAQGVFDRFWFWTFQYARAYVSELSLADAPGVFAQAWRMVTVTSLPIWIVAGVGLAALWLVRQPKDARAVLTLFSAASVLAILPGFYFRPHYFVLLLPAVALACGIAAASVAAIVGQRASRAAARAAGAALVVAAAGWFVAADARYLFTSTGEQVHRALYSGSPFLAAPIVADHLRSQTGPSDRIAVLGSEPEIYFYADRRAATGHIYMYGLMEPQPFAERMQQELIDEVEAARPLFVVEVRSPHSWLTRPSSNRRVLSWMRRYLDACYTRAGLAEPDAAGRPVVRWDEEARTMAPRTDNALVTYRRTGDAACQAPPHS